MTHFPKINRLRLLWKGWSKPVKRKGLGTLTMIAVEKAAPDPKV